ncbi:MAG: cysteine hydrolase family protein [Rhodospirillaceae bacterium]|nr:cysteine hydrolase family protein [Rhodospirillaceae bacterium]MDD9916196.1 cysteine hydrolase family protein [Rhodospirillaceae bacterium]
MAQTLRQMAGADPNPHKLANSAVLMIDAQLEYVSGRMPCDGVEAALEQGGKLIAKARTAGRPVIHIQHKGASGGVFDPDTDNFLIAPQVAPAGDEPVINKGLPNAFAGTNLEEVFRGLGCDSLIIAGFMTHMCVSTTARAALDLGIPCSVVADACATRDLPDAEGGVVRGRDLHRMELVALSHRFCPIAQSVNDIV